MVAGDLVNTASRVQSRRRARARSSSGESTRRATEAAIVYEDAGAYELQGQGPSRCRSGGRCASIAGARGALKSQGLEAPFVGRDRELRLDQGSLPRLGRRAQGAPRLGDRDRRDRQVAARLGVLQVLRRARRQIVYWHRGRCLCLRRGRDVLGAGRHGADARAGSPRTRSRRPRCAKLRADARGALPRRGGAELRRAAPRAPARSDGAPGARPARTSSRAWRLLLRAARRSSYPIVLVFEDMQWADATLLDFVEYLLDWSRSHPIFVLTLARPELLERQPDLGRRARGTSRRSTSSRSPQQAMEELLTGLVPGLPAEVREQILARAEGVPLYAVETVRMLLDRGLLVAGWRRLPARPGRSRTLEVPETLHAPDRRAPRRPRRRRSGGCSRTPPCSARRSRSEALAALAGRPRTSSSRCSSSLVRKEVLGVQADPRSPERGQYGFLQDLVRRVAYETLVAEGAQEPAPRGRGAPRGAASARTSDEIVEVVASALPRRLRGAARRRRRGRDQSRARASCSRAPASGPGHLPRSARRGVYFEQAAELADDPLEKARAARAGGRDGNGQCREFDAAERALFDALELAVAKPTGDTHAAARVAARLAAVEASTGRHRTRRSSDWSVHSPPWLARRAGRRPRRPRSAAGTVLRLRRRRSTAPSSGSSSRSTSPRRSGSRRRWSRGSGAKAMLARAGGRPEEALALPATCRSDRARARPVGRQPRTRVLATSRTPASSATATRRRSKSSQEALALARRVGNRR